MGNAKEIRSKISSIENTQKITKAMEMVASSKLKKSQNLMKATKSYVKTARIMVSHAALSSSNSKNIYFESRKIKRVAYFVVSTDRGLCGGLNTNLFKNVLVDSDKWKNSNIPVDFSVIGSKAASYFSFLGLNILSQKTNLEDKPNLDELIGTIKVLLDEFKNGQIDAIFIGSNQFINTMSQKPLIRQLLPIIPSDDEKLNKKSWDYIYEPNSESLVELLVERYIESEVYQSVVDNLACEQAARMIAMKAATDSGTNLIQELKTIYNKARQSAITNELIDIVSGASAV